MSHPKKLLTAICIACVLVAPFALTACMPAYQPSNRDNAGSENDNEETPDEQFTLSTENARALLELTNSREFDLIDHNEIGNTGNIELVLRARDGADKGLALVRATAMGFNGGPISTFTTITEPGKVKNVSVARVDANNSWYNRLDVEQLISEFVGKSNLDSVIDGSTGATSTSNALQFSVRNALAYYQANNTALSSAPAKGAPIILPEPEPEPDLLLTTIQQIYPDATAYMIVQDISLNAETSIQTYAVDNYRTVYGYTGYVYFGEDPSDKIQVKVLFAIANNKVDTSRIAVLQGDYFTQAAANDIDGNIGATYSQAFLKQAVNEIETYHNQNA